LEFDDNYFIVCIMKIVFMEMSTSQ